MSRFDDHGSLLAMSSLASNEAMTQVTIIFIKFDFHGHNTIQPQQWPTPG